MDFEKQFFEELTQEINRAGFSINDKKTRVQYKDSHQEVTGIVVNKKLNVDRTYYKDTGDIESRGSGNYASDEAKEIARLKRELRDAQDALEVLKKAINILGK